MQQLTPIETNIIREQVIEAIRTIYDPEIPVNIFELGLIYKTEVDDAGQVTVDMTLTSPGCPAAQSLPVEVETKVKRLPDVNDVTVNVVWEPAWSMDLMSEEARLELGFW